MDENLEKEVINYLSQYLRINTTNPPGKERKAADFLGNILKKRKYTCTKVFFQPLQA